jgi:hypothetical protein
MALRAVVLFRSWKAPAPLTGVAWLQWRLLELRREERSIARKPRDGKPCFIAALLRMTAKGEGGDKGQIRSACCHAGTEAPHPAAWAKAGKKG